MEMARSLKVCRPLKKLIVHNRLLTLTLDPNSLGLWSTVNGKTYFFSYQNNTKNVEIYIYSVIKQYIYISILDAVHGITLSLLRNWSQVIEHAPIIQVSDNLGNRQK
jgi:hypothetical protein